MKSRRNIDDVRPKSGIVELADHDPEWEKLARETIGQLWCVFGAVAKDIQHVGSTAIKGIKAKPIIDIAVAVESFEALSDVLPHLEKSGIYKSVQHAVPNGILYVIGDFENDTRTHHIHIVMIDSIQWQNNINLRNYLNDCPERAATYNTVKVVLYSQYANDRNAYTEGK